MGHGNDDYTYDDCELWSIFHIAKTEMENWTRPFDL